VIAVDTPAVVVDVDRLERNLERWQAHCDDISLSNRPHIKTLVGRRGDPRRRRADHPCDGRQPAASGPSRPRRGEQVALAGSCSRDGFGTILEAPRSSIVRLTEEHAVVVVAAEDALELGQRVRIVPNHVCVVVNLADELVVHSGGLEPTTWPVDARGRSR
jgi:D-serine deaminase-like pyridoxal phosphate-dependent protein